LSGIIIVLRFSPLRALSALAAALAAVAAALRAAAVGPVGGGGGFGAWSNIRTSPAAPLPGAGKSAARFVDASDVKSESIRALLFAPRAPRRAEPNAAFRSVDSDGGGGGGGAVGADEVDAASLCPPSMTTK
jgi:hypothetical protein